MKNHMIIRIVLLFVLTGICNVFTEQESSTQPDSETIQGLDLEAVGELFKDSESLEAFEEALNDPENGINNLDMDENGDVDFIRVSEEVNDDVHFIVLQACLGEDDFQDVATIEVEKSDEDYNMEVHGDENLYGADYYIVPVGVRIHTWPVIKWLYRPAYHPYRSKYYFGYYPHYWRPFRPVKNSVYHTRTVVYTRRAGFTYTRNCRIKGVKRVKYIPRKSMVVKRKVVRTPSGTKVITKTKRPGKKPVVKKKTVKRR